DRGLRPDIGGQVFPDPAPAARDDVRADVRAGEVRLAGVRAKAPDAPPGPAKSGCQRARHPWFIDDPLAVHLRRGDLYELIGRSQRPLRRPPGALLTPANLEPRLEGFVAHRPATFAPPNLTARYPASTATGTAMSQDNDPVSSAMTAVMAAARYTWTAM